MEVFVIRVKVRWRFSSLIGERAVIVIDLPRIMGLSYEKHYQFPVLLDS